MVRPEVHNGAGNYGLFNFMDDTVQPSLFRNGEVLTKRDPDGNDFGTVGLSLTEKRLEVSNCSAQGWQISRPIHLHGGMAARVTKQKISRP